MKLSIEATIVMLAAFPVLVCPGAAFSEPEQRSWPVKRVVLIDARDFRVNPDALFVDGEAPSEDRSHLDAAADSARVTLAGEAEIEVVGVAGTGLADEDPDSTEYVVRGMLHLGIERYRDIRLVEAISVLEGAISLARESYVDVLMPALVSDLYLFLGLCRLETGDPDMAHIALKNMFLYSPGRRFRSGWFPQTQEKALRAAALDFAQSPPRENPLDTMDRVAGFLRRHRVDALIYLYLWPGSDGSPLIETRVFERSLKDAETIEITRDSRLWTGPEAASLAISSWLACADIPSRTDTTRRLPRLFLNTGFSYSMFAADNTTRTGFHNLGVAVGFAYQIQPGLDTFMKLNVFRTLEDSYGDLLDDFWSLRTSIGVGYSAVFSWGRVFTHFGLEMNYLSGFRSSTDPRCKLWPDDPDLCGSSDVSAPSFLFGATGAVGVNVFVSRSVFVMVEVGLSGYFVAGEALSDLNFPFETGFGVGYAFF